ncbi:MAG: winged helix-turn-helix transcriptional regulator [Clostridia bacterium]|nr:winged helix-turn-helix transcriptional regulator [Clostridia bacterium]MBR1686211.1 winged helix-turn-helix transcriptional regulator [Clostridia bacterium]MBR2288543.1 winged helix-turn-helix transcriptional regulator [Clostridia bacterium]
METERLTQIARALTDENRVQIIRMLAEGEKCACDLLAQLEIGQPTLSHHMKLLNESGLVKTRRSAKWSYYSLDVKAWDAFREEIEHFCAKAAQETVRECDCEGGCGQ